MKPKRVPIFAVTIAVALTSVTGASLGKGGGGRGGGHGGGHGGHGGGHFAGHGGGHHAGGHYGGHHGHYAGGHYGGHHGHYAAGGHLGGSGNRFAGAHQFRGKGGASRNAFGHQAAWNNWAGGGGWGGWGGGWGGWVGPVFWPFLLGDILSYVLWPYSYYYPFWSYGTFPGYYYGGYASAYDYSYGYGYGYGGLSDIYGYSRGGYSRPAGQTSHNAAQADKIPADVTQSCGGFAPGVTSFPVDRMREAIQPIGSQSAALNDLATASSKASSIVAASCPAEPPLTPLARLDAVEQRLDAMIQAVQIVRPALARLYDSLSDEQRQRLDALGAEESHNGGATPAAGPTGAGTLSTLCDRQAASFTKLPVQGVEEIVKPKDQQQTAFENLKQASAQAADELRTSCSAQTAATPVARLDAASNRLQALVQAVKTVRPTLGAFYASLGDEQKARFNNMGQQNSTRSDSATGIRKGRENGRSPLAHC